MYEAILFDLDGTLTDPKIGITSSVQYALAKLGIEEDSLDKLTPFIGPPLMDSFRDFYNLSEEDCRRAVGFYRERFAAGGLYENVVYLGIPELLQSLRNQKKKLILATSKPTVFSVKILEHFDLYQYFDAVIGSNLDGTRVDKGEVIEAALAELTDSPFDKTIMVGDRKHDVIGARKNGIKVISVAYGYGSMEELRAAKPDFIADSVKTLGELLKS